MSYGNRLFHHRKLYDYEGTKELFFQAIKENVIHHQKDCLEYAQILQDQGFHISQLQSIKDIEKIPPLPTLFLKKHTLVSTSSKHLLLKSTSSGTSGGNKSEMGLDFTSAWRGLGMVLNTFFTHKLVSVHPTNHIVLGYQPSKANKMGAVKTAFAITFAAFPLHREYALKYSKGDYILNIDGIGEALLRYQKSGLPVRFMGFPPYFMFLLQELKTLGIRLKLHPKSLVILAGGWKQFWSQEVEKGTIYAMAQEILGLGSENIKEFFGAVEHPISYFACSHHHFHIPIYSRVIIRNNRMQPVDYGEAGLLNLMTPMMTSMPFTSVLTDDLAVLYPGKACGCGNKAPYFEILGRVNYGDIKTCSAGAAELLQVKNNVEKR